MRQHLSEGRKERTVIRILPDTVTDEVPGILLASHGELSKGTFSAVRMIYGDCENLAVLGFEETDDPAAWGDELENVMGLFPAGVIILLDLFGGTPCNQCLLKTVGKAKAGEKVSVVAGLNLGMVLELLGQRDTAGFEELTQTALDAGTSAVSDCLERFRSLFS